MIFEITIEIVYFFYAVSIEKLKEVKNYYNKIKSVYTLRFKNINGL